MEVLVIQTGLMVMDAQKTKDQKIEDESAADLAKGTVLMIGKEKAANHRVHLTKIGKEVEAKKEKKEKALKRNLLLLLVGSDEGRVFGIKHQLD